MPRNAQKCIVFTPFLPFLAKKKKFKNPASSDFWNHRKLSWRQKSEKTMEPFERNPSGRTDARTYEGKSIVPPKFFGSVQITIEDWYCGYLHDKNWRFCAFSIIFDVKFTLIDVNDCAISIIFIWHTNRLQELIQTIIKTINKWYCDHLHNKIWRFCAFSIIFDVRMTS